MEGKASTEAERGGDRLRGGRVRDRRLRGRRAGAVAAGLAAALVLTLTACGGDDSDTGEDTPSGTPDGSASAPAGTGTARAGGTVSPGTGSAQTGDAGTGTRTGDDAGSDADADADAGNRDDTGTSDGDGDGTGDGGDGSPSTPADALEGSWLATTDGKAVALVVTGKQAGLFAVGGTVCSGTAGDQAGALTIRLKCTGGDDDRATGRVESVGGSTLKVDWEGGVGVETYTKAEGARLPSGLPTADLGS
ncbi:hypothetical protein [Streptomyces ziwulingensis]|uniref:hypothetical protein n=1 Tax=Streptomyces ziwulingensis TaxID=1045501 RepID=UPI003CD0BEFD